MSAPLRLLWDLPGFSADPTCRRVVAARCGRRASLRTWTLDERSRALGA